MSRFVVHSFIVLLVTAAHMAAYWGAMSRASFDWTSFSNFLPFLTIVGSIVGAAVVINILLAALWLNRSDSTTDFLRLAAIYLIWFVSAFSLYVMNKGVDAYSATLGVFICMPLHTGAVFVLNLFITMIFKLFGAPPIEQK